MTSVKEEFTIETFDSYNDETGMNSGKKYFEALTEDKEFETKLTETTIKEECKSESSDCASEPERIKVEIDPVTILPDEIKNENKIGFVKIGDDSNLEFCNFKIEDAAMRCEDELLTIVPDIFGDDREVPSPHHISDGNNTPHIRKSFDKAQLILVKNTCRSTPDYRYSCEICNKVYTDRSSLCRHRRSHTGERPYSCKICNKSFIQSSHMKAHQRIHTGERPFACGMCNKSFIESGSLRAHERSHKGDRPHTCDICNKTFTEPSNLKVHHRIHTGERPYTCDICEKTFSRSDYLREHQRVHSGERPYTCDICKKIFVASGTLKRHMRKHSDQST